MHDPNPMAADLDPAYGGEMGERAGDWSAEEARQPMIDRARLAYALAFVGRVDLDDSEAGWWEYAEDVALAFDKFGPEDADMRRFAYRRGKVPPINGWGPVE